MTGRLTIDYGVSAGIAGCSSTWRLSTTCAKARSCLACGDEGHLQSSAALPMDDTNMLGRTLNGVSGLPTRNSLQAPSTLDRKTSESALGCESIRHGVTCEEKSDAGAEHCGRPARSSDVSGGMPSSYTALPFM